MGLDQFGFAPKKKKTTKKSSKKSRKKSKKSSKTKKTPETSSTGRNTFHLKCTVKKCGYERTLKKRALKEEDYECRKCAGKMILKK